MAMTALILVASGGAEDSQASAAEVVWTELADPQRVALAQSLMEGNRQLQLTKLQGDPSEPAFLGFQSSTHSLFHLLSDSRTLSCSLRGRSCCGSSSRGRSGGAS